MPKKETNYTNPGDLIAIPLFLLDVSPRARVKKADLEVDDGRFGFARVIANSWGVSGIIVEVFNVTGPLSAPLDQLHDAPRLFRPTPSTTLQFRKRRWKVVGATPGYDPETHSRYSQVEIVAGARTEPVLLRGGKKIPISKAEALAYEPAVYHQPQAIERRILIALGELEPKKNEPWLHPT